MSINKIKLIPTLIRTSLLRLYMAKAIDESPYQYSFSEFIHRYYASLIPETPEYYKARATHCYYCDHKLSRGNKKGDDIRRSSIDHYHPKSRGSTEKFVICCADCNTRKDNMPPEKVGSQMISANMKGRTMWGYSGKKLHYIAGQFQNIAHDLLFKTGPRIYYVIK